MPFANLELARRLEKDEAYSAADYAFTMERMSPAYGARAMPVGGGYAVYTGKKFPINRVVGFGLSQRVTKTDLSFLEDFYRKRELPAEIELCPLAPHMVVELLNGRGYTLTRFFNMHVRELSPNNVEATDSDVRIELVEPENSELWTTTVVGAASEDEIVPDDPSLILAKVTFHRPNVSCYVAYWQGKPAAAAALEVRERTATLFSAYTRPEYRKHGLQTALIQARLTAAAGVGCDLAHIRTVPGSDSQRNIERAGFSLAYTKVIMSRDVS